MVRSLSAYEAAARPEQRQPPVSCDRVVSYGREVMMRRRCCWLLLVAQWRVAEDRLMMMMSWPPHPSVRVGGRDR